MKRKVGIVIDRDRNWREIFAKVLNEAEFDYYALTDVFSDDPEASVFIVASLSPSGIVVGPDYVARFRVSHPDGFIIAVSADLSFRQKGATISVKEQFLAAGADRVVDKTTYSHEEFIKLLKI